MRVEGRGVQDDLVDVLGQAVGHGGGHEPASLFEPGAQFRLAARGGFAGEDQIAEYAQPEDVEGGGVRGLRGHLGGEIGVGGLGDVRGEVVRRDDLVSAAQGGAGASRDTLGAGMADRRLPFGDLENRVEPAVLVAAGSGARAGQHVDGAGVQGAVEEEVAVRVVDGLGQAAQEGGPCLGVQLRAVLEEVVVQAERARVVGVQQGGAGAVAVLVEVLQGDQARVSEAFQCACLALGGVADGLAGLPVRSAFAQVDAYAAGLAQGVVTAEVVGPVRPGVERGAVQAVGADVELGIGTADADLGQELAQPAGELAVDARLDVTRGTLEFGEDVAQPAVPGFAEDARQVAGREPDAQTGVGEEDQFLDVGDVTPGVGLPQGVPEQALELLRLLVGEVAGVAVEAGAVAGEGLHPARSRGGDRALPVLQFHQEETGRSGDQQVDLADVAAVGGEGEVRPGAVGLGVREPLLEIQQSAALVLELRLGDSGPPAVSHDRDAPFRISLSRLFPCRWPDHSRWSSLSTMPDGPEVCPGRLWTNDRNRSSVGALPLIRPGP
ncbi:hypothetical protein HUV60_020035 [Streptomyces sp. KMM 9044]|nr:hypothetical protein [Streptomyces sp. KMM 9044]WAX79619.1 hypothetical protein HUV60_020035 [Streptomyces sp. KMM 9044]